MEKGAERQAIASGSYLDLWRWAGLCSLVNIAAVNIAAVNIAARELWGDGLGNIEMGYNQPGQNIVGILA